MNFLAHLYLTRNQPEKVTIGNFIADAVKGKNGLNNYEETIRKGIIIHRAIDNFTDRHPIFKQGTKRLHQKYGKFAPIIMDIIYDHLLASNWSRYDDSMLQSFADSRYALIEKHYDSLPERTRMWFSYMKHNNLLYNYAKEEEIEIVLHRMDGRTGGISGMGNAINEFRIFKKEFTAEFDLFFHEIIEFLDEHFFSVAS